MNCLAIAPGVHRERGWISIEADPARGGDYVAKIPPLPADVNVQKWDAIEWIHGIGSVYPWEAAGLLRDFYGMLRQGGKLMLEQPDFAKACERVEWVFGDPSFSNPLHMNKWAYTPESLTALLHACGYSRVHILPAQHHLPDRDFRAEAYR